MIGPPSLPLQSSQDPALPAFQNPSLTTPASLTVVYQRWHHQATPGPRVSSAPSSLMPGGEERKER